MADHDLIIVGGGIGGSAMASVMARAGYDVLLLEQSEVYEDRVRGEWIAPWGVVETKRVGLYDLLKAAGGHHLDRHISYDETIAPETAEAAPLDMGVFLPEIEGPLCLGHPHHCQTLFDEAGRSGARTLRGVQDIEVSVGVNPQVSYTLDGAKFEASARLVIGADGRTSIVREACGIALEQDPPHHMFGGMLVEGAHGWSDKIQAIGTEGNFSFLAFPQGDGRVRVYGSFALDERRRFAGPDGQRAFLDAFALDCSPANQALVAGEPAGPLRAYFNNPARATTPVAPGVVLVGDAAGWSDPIVGLGLSITYRDVRMVSEILKAATDWSAPDLFASYIEERKERQRRIDFAADLTSRLDAEFGEEARERRKSYHHRGEIDSTLKMHAVAVMAGPEMLPPDFFTDAHRQRVLNG